MVNVFQESCGGARERNDAQVPRGANEVDSVAYAWSWLIVAGRMTVAPPPTMFCNGANERQWPQSWVGVPCGSALRCVLACTAMPSWANRNASDSSWTIWRL